MSDAPASPRAARLATPRWLDGRLVLGVLLVLLSVVVGARVLATADRSQQVWAATRDLAPGSTLAAGDLARSKVRLFEAGDRYLVAAGSPPVGYVLARGVGASELLPRQALVAPQQAAGRELREVSVPVTVGHLPDDLQAGQQVDVFVTPGGTAGGGAATAPTGGAAAPTGSASGTPGAATQGTATPGTATPGTGATRKVLSAVPVRLRPPNGGVTATRASAVVLSVSATDADLLVAALQEGSVDLVRVPRDSEVAPLGTAGPPR